MLAAALAFLVLAAATFSVSHALHNSLHASGSTDHHLCLLCSLAKGQVSGAEVALTTAVLVICVATGLRLTEWLSLPGIDYRLLPSRAPPCS